MKTFRNLYPKIITFENVWDAYKKARKGKRYKPYTLAFSNDAERELWSIIWDLENKTYQPGPYHSFMIRDPKERLISAAPFRDRIVHHALCNVIEPLYDRIFIYDSYACRIGKGTHRAIFRSWEFMEKNRYVLKCDVKQFFPSMDHDVLKTIIRKKMRCPDTLRLIDLIIDHGSSIFEQPGKGVPIGNLTSQFFANIYLNELDQFMKTFLGAQFYIRYMDDFMIFHDSKEFLRECRNEVRGFLGGLKLELHPTKQEIFPVSNGFEFLGFFHTPERVRVRKEEVNRFIKRLRHMRWMYEKGLTSLDKIGESIRCWSAHASYANSYRLRRNILKWFAV